jgi:mannose-6-phosphate isomerase-like protein (cupin superfamily)
MSTTGTTLESPRIGQTITFIRTAAGTAGAEVVIEARMRPGAFIPPHVHLLQEENFEVLDGTGTFRVAGKTILAGPGEHVDVDVGARVGHRFRNASATDVHVRTLRPALPTEDLFERLFRLGAAGRVPWTTAALIRGLREKFFYFAGVPIALQRLLAGTRP